MAQVMQNRIERPSAIVCIAYHQLSMMTGIKDPTEIPKVEKIEKGSNQMDAIVKKSFADCTNIYMQNFFQFSKDVAESFGTMLDNLKARIEEFHEQNRSIFDLFSFSNLQEWFERKQ